MIHKTSINVATAITKLVAVDALPAIVGEMVIGNLVTRDFEPTLAQHGETVKCCDDTLIVMDKWIEATFQIPDISKVLAVPDLLPLYMRPATNAIAEQVDAAIMGLRFASLGEGLSDAAIDAIDVRLFCAGVSASTSKYLVADVDAYSQLRRIPRFSEYRSSGDAGLRVLVDGPVGKIGNIYVFRSRAATRSIAFTKDSIRLAIRRLPLPSPGTGAIAEYAEYANFGIRVVVDYQPNTLAQQFTISALCGCSVTCESHGIEVTR